MQFLLDLESFSTVGLEFALGDTVQLPLVDVSFASGTTGLVDFLFWLCLIKKKEMHTFIVNLTWGSKYFFFITGVISFQKITSISKLTWDIFEEKIWFCCSFDWAFSTKYWVLPGPSSGTTGASSSSSIDY